MIQECKKMFDEVQRLRFVFGFGKVNELLADLDFYDQGS